MTTLHQTNVQAFNMYKDKFPNLSAKQRAILAIQYTGQRPRVVECEGIILMQSDHDKLKQERAGYATRRRRKAVTYDAF